MQPPHKPATESVIEHQKQQLRRQIRQITTQLSGHDRDFQSRAAAERLIHTPDFSQAATVMMFLSLPDEIDISYILNAAFAQNKTVTLPQVIWGTRDMAPIIMPHPDCPMISDRMGLSHPADSSPLPVDQLDLIIVPGRAFDPDGGRLGRGGGFYDRFLKNNAFTGIACGYAYESQIFPDVPVEPHDITMDLLVTDQLLRRCLGRNR